MLRKRLRARRLEHVTALPDVTRGLLFLRPPVPIAKRLPEGAKVGLYAAAPLEAPTRSYARWLHENGWALSLPWFAERGSAMQFRAWNDPYDETLLETGPYGITQPRGDAPATAPSVLFVPLIGFTPDGHRLGQGGGHYDRWLQAHPNAQAIGLAWDCQMVEKMPVLPHDVRLSAVITPTRLYQAEA